jgi:hypothetical protein
VPLPPHLAAGVPPSFIAGKYPEKWRHFWAVRTGEYTNVSAALKHEFGAEWLFFGLPEPGALKFMDADPGLERAEVTADFALYRVLP